MTLWRLSVICILRQSDRVPLCRTNDVWFCLLLDAVMSVWLIQKVW